MIVDYNQGFKYIKKSEKYMAARFTIHEKVSA